MSLRRIQKFGGGGMIGEKFCDRRKHYIYNRTARHGHYHAGTKWKRLPKLGKNVEDQTEVEKHAKEKEFKKGQKRSNKKNFHYSHKGRIIL